MQRGSFAPRRPGTADRRSRLRKRRPSHVPPQPLQKPPQTSAQAAQRAPSTSLDFRPALTWGHVASPLNGTYCLKLVPQVHFLPSGN